VSARLERVRRIAEGRLRDRPPAHDVSHVSRVAALARAIAEAERANVDVVVAAAWMHEHVNLPKDHPDSARSGDLCAEAVAPILRDEGFDAAFVDAVAACIRDHAFSKGAAPSSMEARVLQDADRLDAIGAIGIARCFATTTEMRRPFYAPDDPFCRARAPNDKEWGIDHFFRKLLRIPSLLHTDTARAMAKDRLRAMESFLDQLAREIGVEPRR
jgi:uncharacterized protein